MRSTLVALGLLPLALGCGRTDGFFGVGPSATPGTTSTGRVDAGVAPVADAGVMPVADAGVPPRDGGTSSNPRLGDILTCDLNEDEAVEAAARFVACFGGLTMPAILDAYEGFVLGTLDPNAASIASVPFGCGLWQCAAQARYCDEFSRCLAQSAIAIEDCPPFSTRCDGDLLGVCLGGLVTPHVDCARLGARCEEGACVKSGCRFGNGENPPACDAQTGTLELCDIGLDCGAYLGEPARCASLYVQGEAPLAWCSPAQVGSVPGVYDRPVNCTSGVVTFTTVSGRTVEYDCRAEGYRGCNQDGCWD